MKPSRERNLASRGLLPLTAPDGVCFVPVDFGQPLEQQGPFDIMLHKATDELISGGPKQLPDFSARIASLAAYTKAHPETVLVDSLDKVHQVDRLGPDAETRHLLAQSGIRLPCIVKPRVACGTPEAHQMAVVLQEDGFQDLQVAMPACLQQFINHNGVLHKVYVMGDQMHVAERQSIPNLPAVATQAAGLPQVFAFDSLKSLPHRDYLQPHYESQQQPAGVHFIIDVNYFPSYKEFPNAAKALSDVLKKAFHTQ
ncbi:MAG: inositol-tetrakisphosphate 1-kinase 4-like, partial [Trebouxia sp. A1-2]